MTADLRRGRGEQTEQAFSAGVDLVVQSSFNESAGPEPTAIMQAHVESTSAFLRGHGGAEPPDTVLAAVGL